MPFQAQIITAMTRNLEINRGNPRLDAITADLSHLGLKTVGHQMATKNQGHAGDVARLQQLVALRNALAHDDQDKLRTLSRQGAHASKQYVISSRASLGRLAKSLDEVVWDYLVGSFSTDPWSP